MNQNYTDIINGVSDGTKDLSISALTCAGNATFNGTTNTIGNASSDDIVITASLASTINIKTTNTYDIGSSTKGLRYIYIGDTADANTHKIQGQALSSDVTLTLPSRTGTFEVVPALSSSQTNTYAILSTDDVVLVSGASNAFSATLPTAVGCAGKQYIIKRTDLTLANVVTIATTSSQTIDGATTRKLCTQYEWFKVISDGSNWHILEHGYPSTWVEYTPTFTGFGTVSNVDVFSRRVGDSLEIECSFTAGTTSANSAKMTLGYGGTNANVTVDTAKISAANLLVGHGYFAVATAVSSTIMAAAGDNTVLFFGRANDGAFSAMAAQNGDAVFSGGVQFSFFAKVPITNWEG